MTGTAGTSGTAGTNGLAGAGAPARGSEKAEPGGPATGDPAQVRGDVGAGAVPEPGGPATTGQGPVPREAVGSAAGRRREHRPGSRWLVRRWPVALALVLFGLTVAGDMPVPPWVVLGIALVYPVVGILRRTIRDRSTLLLQAAGLAVFAAVSLLAAVVDPVSSAVVVAAGLVGHALWDAFHHRAGAVVWRWYAEACVVYDLLLAAAVLAAVV